MPGFEIVNHEERKAVDLLFKESGILMAHGFDKIRKKYHVREFEKHCSNYFKSKYCLAVSSGTAAIKIGLLALGVKRGDEIITQAFNFIATIEAILDLGAKPIIVEVDETLNMSPIDLKKKISIKTKVVIPVHMLGVSANMSEIKKICKKKKIKVMEDNCESVGAKYKKKFLGTVSDVGIFSFDHGKIMTTGEGGLILSDNKKIIDYCKEYHDHGHQNNPKFSRGEDTRKIYGFNYRMTELQGVIGKVQLKKLTNLIANNKKKYQILEKQIKNFFPIRSIPKNTSSNYDTFIFFVRDYNKKNKIIKFLKKNKIGTKNLPDAIKWHCSYYWSHALNKNQIKNSKKTLKILKNSIAIPILCKKNYAFYKKIALGVSKI